MRIDEVKRNTKLRKPIKVGRGGTRGKTSGRGMKGQNSRAGAKKRPEIRDMIKKLPKLRGRGKNINKAFRQDAQPVSLGTLDIHFKDGERVSPSTLFEKGLVKRENGKLPMVKVLASGELTKKVELKNCLVSASAKEAIEKAGGKVK